MPKAKKQDLTKEVMKEIHEGHVKMRPRIYFVVGSLLLGGGLAAAAGVAAFFVNLIFFRLHAHTPFDFLKFGRLGLKPFLAIFPWLPLLVAIVGIAVGIALLKQYDFSYKKSFVGILLGFLAAVLTAGLLLNFSGLNKRTANFKALKPFYKRSFVGKEFVVGEVLSVEDQEITVTTPRGEEVVVTWDEATLLPTGADFEAGDTVRAVGERQDDGTFAAKGIGKGGPRPWLEDDRVKGFRERRLPVTPPPVIERKPLPRLY